MKAVFVSPYLKNYHAGGGEKHLFDVALALPKQIEVCIAIPQFNGDTRDIEDQHLASYKQFYEQFLGVSLHRCRFIATPLFTNAPWWEKLWWTRSFSHLYYVSDGSAFFSLARRSILHIQTPPHLRPSFLTKLKVRTWSEISCNSQFTRSVFIRLFGASFNTSVLYPMADQQLFSVRQAKENIILHVGRFFVHQHSKRQDVIVEMFRQLLEKYPHHFDKWRLVLVGAIENQNYFQDVKAKSKGLPVELRTDCSRHELLNLYGKATIFWSATGYGKNEHNEPQVVEHFGKAVVEAMAAGAIPIITNKGGHSEILTDSLSHLLWKTKQECIERTAQVVQNMSTQGQLRRAVINRAKDFSQTKFRGQVRALFHLA